MEKIFSSFALGNISLSNRIIMAPMTRSRAIGNIPNSLIANYYAQRAGAGLIITEGTSPSPNGLGYSRIPGIYSPEQVDGWKQVTKAVHQKGGKIFIQFMHTGRIGHTANLPKGAVMLAPSAIKAAGQMWTDTEGMQDHPTPKAMTTSELKATIQEYVTAAKNAIEAGFDGVELHGANGYLIEQFLSPHSNQRTDDYGGSVKNRVRFLAEVAQNVANAIGKEKVGLRISPYGTFNDMPHYPEIDATYQEVAQQMNQTGIAYIHIVNNPALHNSNNGSSTFEKIRNAFKNTLIINGGFTKNSAEEFLQSGKAELVAFGRPFISNPDLVERFKKNLPLANADHTKFYTADEIGYTDYPVYQG